MLHHANAHDEGEETVVLSSGWGPAQMQALQRGSGMIRNLKLVHYGDFSALPYTALWRHRCGRFHELWPLLQFAQWHMCSSRLQRKPRKERMIEVRTCIAQGCTSIHLYKDAPDLR